ncbi:MULTISPECIES: tetraacyldisaccharide 4'-kinase [Myroides]|uniref:Tetraacyldisaccharide 4'-kinase n=1 Tax=Myroides albus TaxID=2562892 RepID=A0A6I3LMY9_9FLAO|nr:MULTISPECIES: tetraacyldisaccharide 4'-kinase [Myroides]MTG98690.1 tetraacyldisaccharide 4'-kinase [Myroides albus]MVX37279.1 tetraacyldisaccharide 4'-kinase [Myroides sp. LoEW2-1]UVD78814.1 tetraacyldisaccharide 4'-kinase [Myroides albus]
MQTLRFLLFPFAILYGIITSIRNCLYTIGLFKRTSFDIPTIAVGNLSVGGTGKTPMVEYIIRLLKDQYQITTLSRGYKRKSEGFILANDHTTMEEIGDEPFQYHSKFDNINVAVDAKRVNGIHSILKNKPDTQAVILDDAFQHLAAKAGFYILLTTYDEPYYSDYMLPTGNLRESRSGAKRANIVIVTKCPKNLTLENQRNITEKLNLKTGQLSFFTYIEFSKLAYTKSRSVSLELLKNEDYILVAGIAKPQSFFDHLKNEETECLTFPDHHHFSPSDVELILQKAGNKNIITTEKDYVRLQNLIPSERLYYLPIQTSFINNHEVFDKIILDYVGTSTRNS